ncbi:hypothetical protein [Sulfuritalea sp.]|uniref:hypothetical protein n=1 Tax=Sulfuritalea sp. TaxID=2480090 RepID=UPI00286EA016|nr:hypothetical protein [Sulfuritalea sp.]
MKTRTRLATLCVVLATLPLGAIAADPAPPMSSTPAPAATPGPAATGAQAAPIFEQLDGNRDGFVTKDEAKRSADVTARFKELDADRDGKISAVEFRKTMPAK